MIRALLILAVYLSCAGCQLPQVRPVLDADALRAAVQVIQAGTASLRSGNFVEANQYYQLAYQLGKQAEALDGLGCVAFAQGNLELAMARFNDALERSPNLSEVYGHIGIVLEQRGSIVEAERHFQQGLAVKPSDIALRYEYAQFLARHGRSADSKILIAQVRSMIPKTVSFRLKRG